VGFLLRLGLDPGPARITTLIVAAIILIAAWQSDELTAFARAAAAGIVASPVLRVHYWIALLVPLADARPQLRLSWLAVLALWLSATEPVSHTWQYLVPFAVVTVWLLGIRAAERSGTDLLRVGVNDRDAPATSGHTGRML
jgi:hypothetical protein